MDQYITYEEYINKTVQKDLEELHDTATYLEAVGNDPFHPVCKACKTDIVEYYVGADSDCDIIRYMNFCPFCGYRLRKLFKEEK